MPRTDKYQLFQDGVLLEEHDVLVSDDQIEREQLSANLQTALDRLDQIVTQGRAVEGATGALTLAQTVTQLRQIAGALADVAFIERRIIRRLLGV